MNHAIRTAVFNRNIRLTQLLLQDAATRVIQATPSCSLALSVY